MPTWIKRLIAIVVSVGVLFGLGEGALRLIVPSTIESAVRSQLRLSPDHPVEVSVGGSLLISALGGRVGDLTLAVPDAPLLDELTADVRLEAGSIPFNPLKGNLEDASIQLSVPQEQFGPAISKFTNGLIDEGEIQDGALVVGRTMEIFGMPVPLSATLQLGVLEGGDVEVIPEGLSAAGLDVGQEQLNQMTGSLLEPLLKPHTVCVKDQLPRGVELTGIQLTDSGTAILNADLAPGILSDKSEQAKGVCEAG